MTVDDGNRPKKTNLRAERGKQLEDMSPEEELEYLRVENAILKKR